MLKHISLFFVFFRASSFLFFLPHLFSFFLFSFFHVFSLGFFHMLSFIVSITFITSWGGSTFFFPILLLKFLLGIFKYFNFQFFLIFITFNLILFTFISSSTYTSTSVITSYLQQVFIILVSTTCMCERQSSQNKMSLVFEEQIWTIKENHNIHEKTKKYLIDLKS